jgi:hypothetical protein
MNRWTIFCVLGLIAAALGDLPMPNYGNWCGAGHGGYQDCCAGGDCPHCVPPVHGQMNYQLDPQCLTECPPKDGLDLACAWHDTCTFIVNESTECGDVLDAEECFCNCVLSDVACSGSWGDFGLVCGYFEDIGSCWFCNETSPGTYQEECDAWDGAIDWPLDDFCQNGVGAVKNFVATGTIAWNNYAMNFPVCYIADAAANTSLAAAAAKPYAAQRLAHGKGRSSKVTLGGVRVNRPLPLSVKAGAKVKH